MNWKVLVAAALLAGTAQAQDATQQAPGPAAAVPKMPGEPLNLRMEGYDYPYPVFYFPRQMEGREEQMAYMDVPPAPNPDMVAPASPDSARVVVLFHGKNFCGAYWKGTIQALSGAGFRVIVPDQIGFGKSSKPVTSYSFHAMATDTRKLLEFLKISTASVVGHSMGGMLAARFALMFPDLTTRLVLEDPIGLEDYRLQVLYLPTGELFEQEFARTEDQIRNYHANYYVKWQPSFDEWVRLQVRMLQGPDARQAALVSALTSQMIYEQPVCYEWPQIRIPTLLLVGLKDRTSIGKDRVSKEVAEQLGDYPELGKKTAAALPHVKLLEFADVGHVPHLENPEAFQTELVRFLTESSPILKRPSGSPAASETPRP